MRKTVILSAFMNETINIVGPLLWNLLFHSCKISKNSCIQILEIVLKKIDSISLENFKIHIINVLEVICNQLKDSIPMNWSIGLQVPGKNISLVRDDIIEIISLTIVHNVLNNNCVLKHCIPALSVITHHNNDTVIRHDELELINSKIIWPSRLC